VSYAFSRSKADGWFLKFDVRKYFDSIRHDTLKHQIRRIVKDGRVLHLMDTLIDSYETTPGRGVPIGNLTSQFFANLYLSSLDHYILEEVRPPAYVRYMDDGVLWSSQKADLLVAGEHIAGFCAERLHLSLKQCVVNRVSGGHQAAKPEWCPPAGTERERRGRLPSPY
jgi:RNA-directed DNA polymerase